MDRVWLDRLVEALGPRYKLGNTAIDGCELLYRSGKAEFRASRILVGCGASGRELLFTVDVRMPRGTGPADAEPLIRALEVQSLGLRGFARIGDESSSLSSQTGEAAGGVRTLRYRGEERPPADAAKAIRALVESLDAPIIAGSHEPKDLIARDPPPPAPKATVAKDQALEVWKFRLLDGMLHSVQALVDPNERTLKISERRLLSEHQLGETLRLAHVARFAIRRKSGASELLAIGRDSSETVLAQGSGDEFVACAGRMARKTFIPIVEL